MTVTEAAASPPASAPAQRPALRAADLIDAIVDPGSWRGWDHPIALPDPTSPEYMDELARARFRTGLDEAVVTGEGRIGRRRVAVIASEFAFLAGSIGAAAAERITRAVERATAERLPLIASPASGGTRMQEGTPAFVQMIKVAGAVADHKAAGLPYVVYLRHPTTGGAYASWGSLGHLTLAEPRALIGFLGPRVYEALYGEPFPPGVQVAESLHAHGIVDAVVRPDRLRGTLASALTVMCAPQAVPRPDAVTDGLAPDVPAAEALRRTRRPDRPGVRALLDMVARDVTRLNGTGAGETDPGMLLALARLGQRPCVLLGQDRDAQRHEALGPAALRTARRGMRLAAELGLPLVTVIDTPGAALAPEAEHGALAGEIARCLADLVTLPTPTVSVLLGEGTGGAALALLPADRVFAAQHAWLSPLPLEGAAAIRYRSTDRAADVAAEQQITSSALLTRRIVDLVVGERPDAADEPDAFVRRLGSVLEAQLAALHAHDPAQRLAARRRRYRTLGAA
jgi:acetyl-CoA carboxylase carboxyl transferase beta subunit